MNFQLKETIRSLLPTAIRPYRIQAGFLRGRVIYTSLHDYPGAIRGTTETELVDWLRANVRAGETWLDVGSHYGYISLALSLLTGPSGQVYAFEPMLTTAGYLNLTRQANGLSNLVILPFALHASPTVDLVRLPVTRGMADSTLAQADEYEQLLALPFDRFWQDFSAKAGRVAGVKIDVQGMELSVLTGMQGLLKADHPKVVLEFHTGVDRGEVCSLLASCDYALPGQTLAQARQVNNDDYRDNQSYVFLPNA